RNSPVEFGLYFLQYRYYSPSLCRFIAQDSIEYLDPQQLLVYNHKKPLRQAPINVLAFFAQNLPEKIQKN
ncbi:MAG: hypothetical protein IKC47_03050, partial [Clostridia bacterium]|nr:hypothetical protein [Clostridia bacterium]